MKYRISDKLGKCDYQDFNGKEMCNCGNEAFIFAGKKYICKDHLSIALMGDKRPQVYAKDGTEILIKQFKILVDNHKIVKEEKNNAWRI